MVVDHLRTKYRSKNIGIACIYLNHKEVDDQMPWKLLAALWRQLVLDRDVGKLAEDLYKSHDDRGTAPSLEEVVNVLHSSFSEFSTVYIIVDAIDEYIEDRRWILFQHLAAMGPKVNLMITSRPNITPELSLPNLNALEIVANSDDVRNYVDAQIRMSPRLSKHVRTRPELRQEIHSKVTDTVHGM
jgi:Cdc6-like AAA superfamily ATPase